MTVIIDTHNDFVDFARHREEFMDWILRSEEWKVADVDGSGDCQSCIVVLRAVVVLTIEVGVFGFKDIVKLSHA